MGPPYWGIWEQEFPPHAQLRKETAIQAGGPIGENEGGFPGRSEAKSVKREGVPWLVIGGETPCRQLMSSKRRATIWKAVPPELSNTRGGRKEIGRTTKPNRAGMKKERQTSALIQEVYPEKRQKGKRANRGESCKQKKGNSRGLVRSWFWEKRRDRQVSPQNVAAEVETSPQTKEERTRASTRVRERRLKVVHQYLKMQENT